MKTHSTYYPHLRDEAAASEAKEESPFVKNMFVNLVCALTVVGMVLALYVLNAKSKNANGVVSQSGERTEQLRMVKEKTDLQDSFSYKMIPLRLVQFLQ
ncbi:hypothetical protein QTN47_00480 [Danxiaibacter flavus]|uniref:Uncharacterized protein n=2 Tax=Danxiaibacter flavus TaxID=3049108 RepID=A0ABV3Z8T9_9BACT